MTMTIEELEFENPYFSIYRYEYEGQPVYFVHGEECWISNQYLPIKKIEFLDDGTVQITYQPVLGAGWPVYRAPTTTAGAG